MIELRWTWGVAGHDRYIAEISDDREGSDLFHPLVDGGKREVAMPSKTAKQARFMAMCAHTPEKARGKCPPMAVAKEFNAADKGTGKIKPKGKGK